MSQSTSASPLTDNAMSILTERILARDSRGQLIETPDQMFERVAAVVAAADQNYGASDQQISEIADKFKQTIASLRFLPNSPTLVNAGRKDGMLSACFVIPVPDSMEGITQGMHDMALIQKSGGGTGFSFSRLRPGGDYISTTGGKSSGPVPFMKAYNAVTDTIKQEGVRRGANMGVFSVHHPDILEVICLKQRGLMRCSQYAWDQLESPDAVRCSICSEVENCGIYREALEDSKLTEMGIKPSRRVELENFNISIALSDEFMAALESGSSYPLINPRNNQVVRELPAARVFKLIARCAWNIGCPGVLFLDRINRYNPTIKIGNIEATNPCGEQPLLPYESCNLGSINLAAHLKPGPNPSLDRKLLSETVQTAIHFLDNVIDINKYPLAEISEMTRSNRKVGLGVMGYAEVLLWMGLPYGSPEALTLAESIMEQINLEAKRASVNLARIRGPFPNFEHSVYTDPDNAPYPLVPRELKAEVKQFGIRNASVTTIAPTGTLYRIADTTSGIEPIYAPVFISNILDGKQFLEVNRVLAHHLKELKLYSESLLNRIAQAGSLEEFDEIPEAFRALFRSANQIPRREHLLTQAAFQRHTDSAVSKTINLTASATEEEIADSFLEAWQNNLKGITVYRDGSHHYQPLSIARLERYSEKRPPVLEGQIYKIKAQVGTDVQNIYITVGCRNNTPYEVFITTKATDIRDVHYTEMLTRLVSGYLRHGIPLDFLIDQLSKIKGQHLYSLPLKLSQVLKNYVRTDEVCIECGGTLEFSSGCVTCTSCGFSKCE